MLILLLTGLHGRSGNTEWITHLCYCIFQLHNKYYYYYGKLVLLLIPSKLYLLVLLITPVTEEGFLLV